MHHAVVKPAQALAYCLPPQAGVTGLVCNGSLVFGHFDDLPPPCPLRSRNRGPVKKVSHIRTLSSAASAPRPYKPINAAFAQEFPFFRELFLGRRAFGV